MGKHKDRLEIFCREYIKTLNGTNAAIAAGYKANSAHVSASRLLKNAKVKARIAELLKKHTDKLDSSAERVIEELHKLAYSNMLDYIRINREGQADIDLSTLTREQAAAIQEIKVDTSGGTGDGERRQVLRTTFKLTDKGANLERLGRYHKLFTDKVEHSGLEGLADKLHRVRQRKNGS